MNEYINNPKVFSKSWSMVNEKIEVMKIETLQVVADFDNTMTSENGYTSWALFESSGLMPKEYVAERTINFNYYYPMELDPSLSSEEKGQAMEEWTKKELLLFEKYGLSKAMFRDTIRQNKFMHLREGFQNFLNFAKNEDVPFVILSAGVANSISLFMKYAGLLSENVYIVSNELKFDENDICTGIKSAEIIHTENKDEGHMSEAVENSVKAKKDVILLGDSMGDLKMVDEGKMDNVLKIGFLTSKKTKYRDAFIEKFDVVIESDDETFGVLDYLANRLLIGNG